MNADTTIKIDVIGYEETKEKLESIVSLADDAYTAIEKVTDQDGQDLAQLIDSRLEHFFKNARFEIVEVEGEDIKEFRNMLNKYRVVKLDSTDPEPRVFKINKLE